jgi:lysophospholipase L1-like esterase
MSLGSRRTAACCCSLALMIHPNASGARRIADTVWPYLERLVVASAAKVGY